MRGPALTLLCALLLAAPAEAATGGFTYPPEGGGAAVAPTAKAAPIEAAGVVAREVRGKAVIPAGAPQAVKDALRWGNKIVGRPYQWGGGHRSFRSRGYDCSGAVSYALRGAGLLARPLDSSSFLRWGRRGTGRWITVYTNPGHAYVEIAGLRLDTSAAQDRQGGRGARWRPVRRSHTGFRARHFAGL